MWGIGGDVSQFAAEDIARMIAQQQVQQEMQQRAQAAQQRAASEAARMAMDQQQHSRLLRNDDDDRTYRAEDLKLRQQSAASTEADRVEAREVRGLQRRQEGNQTGTRRMIGDFLVQRGDHPDASERATLQGMALQEDVKLPKEVTDPSPAEVLALDEAERERGFKDFTRRADYQEGQMRSRPAKPVRENLTPGQALNATMQLRNTFVRETQAARTVQQQVGLMEEALKASKAGNLAAGSQGVLVTFQKILDPTSVVRESEYARSAAGQSLLSRIEGAATRLAQGGAGVPTRELEQFVSLAKRFVESQAASARETKAQIDGIAEEYGLDPGKITREYGQETPDATTAAPAAGGSLYQQYLNRRRGGG